MGGGTLQEKRRKAKGPMTKMNIGIGGKGEIVRIILMSIEGGRAEPAASLHRVLKRGMSRIEASSPSPSRGLRRRGGRRSWWLCGRRHCLVGATHHLSFVGRCRRMCAWGYEWAGHQHLQRNALLGLNRWSRHYRQDG